MVPIQLCDFAQCAHPAEVVLVIVTVNVVDGTESDPVQRVLCPKHAETVQQYLAWRNDC